MSDAGVIYVASQGLQFVCEAIASAESLKAQAPEVSISLLTDIASIIGTSVPPFDAVLPIEMHAPEGDSRDAWAIGLHVRVTALSQTPYRKTLFLDTDTRILHADIARIFDILEEREMAMVPCTPANSRNCQLFGPMFNGGVIAYRREPRVLQLLGAWEALQRYHLELAAQEPPGETPYLARFGPAERWFLLISDQISLSRLLSPTRNDYGVELTVLDDRWNARRLPKHRLDGVIIDHANRYKVDRRQIRSFLAARQLEHASVA